MVAEQIRELAREFIAAFEAVRDAFGAATALAHDMVQAARRRWQEGRACASTCV